MNNLAIDDRIKPLLPDNFSSYSVTSSHRVRQKNLWLEGYNLEVEDNQPSPATVIVARSYNTLIAILQAGRWVVTTTKYSVTTSRHCNLLRKGQV